MSFEKIQKAIGEYHPSADIELVRNAYKFAANAHKDQVRWSGEPYFVHVVETALLVCQLKLDIPSVAAALLHDTVEDCEVTWQDLADNFGPEIADIVEGVTKLTRTPFTSQAEKQAESFRKMLLAMAHDIRVVIVKLCDRLHNMRTLQFQPEDKQRRIAIETKEIYAPLANRLGIFWLKSELEDLCLMALRPEIYRLIKDSFDSAARQRDEYIEATTKQLILKLEEAGVSASVKGRSKHFYSIWQKMERQNLAFEEIHDLLGFRILVPTVRACYESLGVVHAAWKPVPTRFKDYIAMPKPNMYQSLHTTVIGPQGQRIEMQIRTPEMNKVAEEGIAAHWRYKEGTSSTFDLQWVKELVESQQYLKNPDEFIQSVKGELFPEEVFVFTPLGDLIRLPYQSTPIDFAYAVHTDVGHHTTGARVNGAIVPLSHVLENGDTIEIITAKNHVPNKDWLGFVKTSKAKQRIRAFLRSEEHARSLAIGHEILSKDLRKVKMSLKNLEKEGKIIEIAQAFGLKTEGELYVQVGFGKVPSHKVLAKLLPDNTDVEEQLRKQPGPLERLFQRAARASRTRAGVRVAGFDDVVIRFAKCCEPLPGDRIVGFITRGRGVTIHYAECSEVLQADPLRIVDVTWDDSSRSPRVVRLTVHSNDQAGVLASVTQSIAKHGANIASARAHTDSLGKGISSFEIILEDAQQLQRVIRSIESVSGVIRVERVRRRTSKEKAGDWNEDF